MVKSLSERTDKAAEKALAWAEDMLDLEIAPDDPRWIRVQQLKSRAAAIAAALKARVDPAALRGGTADRVGDLLNGRIRQAKTQRRRQQRAEKMN